MDNRLKPYEKYRNVDALWLYEIPFHWNCEKLGMRFIERRTKVSDQDFAPLSVTKNGIVPQLSTAAKTNDGDNRKLVKSGDFGINSRSDRKGSSGLSVYNGSVSLINIVLKPVDISPKYSHYLLKSYGFIEEFYRNGRGIVADLWTTRYCDMRNINIPLPPREEQDQIVRYLDWKLAKINKFIKAKKKQIEVLKEQKQAIINEAVTYGFLGAILPFGNAEWEKLSLFLNLLIPKLPSPKEEDLSKGILEAIDKSEWKKYKGLHKALKTKKEHDKIEVFLGRKTKAPRKTTAKQIYPLTELLRCSICGHFLGFTERSDRNGLLSVKKCWYVDPYGKKCSNRSAPMNPVIKEINKAIQKHIKDIEEEIEQIDLEKLNSIYEKIQIINKKIKSKEEEINRHVEAFGAGAYTIDFYTKLLSRLNGEKKALSEDVRLLEIEYKCMQEQSSTERVNILKEFVDLIENPDLTWEDQNQLYKTIIDHVDYTKMNDDIMIAITYK